MKLLFLLKANAINLVADKKSKGGNCFYCKNTTKNTAHILAECQNNEKSFIKVEWKINILEDFIYKFQNYYYWGQDPEEERRPEEGPGKEDGREKKFYAYDLNIFFFNRKCLYLKFFYIRSYIDAFSKRFKCKCTINKENF